MYLFAVLPIRSWENKNQDSNWFNNLNAFIAIMPQETLWLALLYSHPNVEVLSKSRYTHVREHMKSAVTWK